MIGDLVKKSRSYRVFDESFKLDKQDLVDLIELARFSPCGKNGQYLRFIPIYKEEILKEIYPYSQIKNSLRLSHYVGYPLHISNGFARCSSNKIRNHMLSAEQITYNFLTIKNEGVSK